MDSQLVIESTYGNHLSGPAPRANPSPMDGVAVLEGMLDRLARGFPVLIFPEGTRSPAHGLGPFQKGAFEAVVRAKVPLIQLKITVDPPTLLKGHAWYHVPDRMFDVTIEVMAIIEPAGFPASAHRLRQEVRDRYVEALGVANP